MKVKTVRPHMNGYGAKPKKASGDEYEIPNLHAAPLIRARLVEEVKVDPAKPAGKSTGGNGAKV